MTRATCLWPALQGARPDVSTESLQGPPETAAQPMPYFRRERFYTTTWGGASQQVPVQKHLHPRYGAGRETDLGGPGASVRRG
eukprot:5964352-Alexandrium_andersonii.AAC.1